MIFYGMKIKFEVKNKKLLPLQFRNNNKYVVRHNIADRKRKNKFKVIFLLAKTAVESGKISNVK